MQTHSLGAYLTHIQCPCHLQSVFRMLLAHYIPLVLMQWNSLDSNIQLATERILDFSF